MAAALAAAHAVVPAALAVDVAARADRVVVVVVLVVFRAGLAVVLVVVVVSLAVHPAVGLEECLVGPTVCRTDRVSPRRIVSGASVR